MYIDLQAEGGYYEVPYPVLQEDAWGRVSSFTPLGKSLEIDASGRA